MSSKEAAIEAVVKLTEVLMHPHPSAILAPVKVAQYRALEKPAEIFCCTVDFKSDGESRVRRANDCNSILKTHDINARRDTGRPRMNNENETK